ncbi:hypothetical protein [Mycobacterium uberis]|uniref:hypothetical protein n=1 Tax=Mycobacterium uberis TaxID=2162698 RepID=UPI001FB20099|nr:hypothetical protein [Mycobacterium uberis]
MRCVSYKWPTPLDELRVVEISDWIADNYCGRLFVDTCHVDSDQYCAQLGIADVIVFTASRLRVRALSVDS